MTEALGLAAALVAAVVVGGLLVGATLLTFAILAPVKRAVARRRRPWAGLPGSVTAEPLDEGVWRLSGHVSGVLVEGLAEPSQVRLEAWTSGPAPDPWHRAEDGLRWRGPAERDRVVEALMALTRTDEEPPGPPSSPP
jgi:hypothetical protein